MNDFKTMLFQSMEDPQIDLTNVSFFLFNLTANAQMKLYAKKHWTINDVAFQYAVPVILLTRDIIS